MAMSFVTFTSFSTGYGLISRSFKMGNFDSEGVMVKRPIPSSLPETVTFLTLDVSTIAWLQGKSDVSGVAPKFENYPSLMDVGILSSSNQPSKQLSLLGVIGIQPSIEAEFTHIDESIVQGRYLEDDERSGVLISQGAAEKLEVHVGDELLLISGGSTMTVSLVGILDDHGFGLIKDIDAEPLIPKKLVLIEGEIPRIEVVACDPSEVIVMDWQTSAEFFKTLLSRVDAKLVDSDSALPLARRLALERDLLVWALYGGALHRLGLEAYTEAKGLSITIPWIIVVLSVVIIMLNSLFERRGEIAILSSLGLNPSHIGGIFMAEAAVIGLLGGGLGYLLGLGGYHLTLALSLAVEVRQKVSAFWCLASVGVAVAAVLVGTGVALRSSVVITPSLLRRWTMGQRIQDSGGKWEFQMPVRLNEDDMNSLFTYLKKRIQQEVLSEHFSLTPELVAKQTKESETEDSEAHVKSIFFNYFFGQRVYLGSSPFGLVAEKKEGERNYKLKLICRGAEEDTIKKIATFIRMLIVDWNARNK